MRRLIVCLAILAAPLAIGQEIDFGDDSGNYPNDGECDDPRFEGPGAYTSPLDEDVLRDASDCLALFDSGQVWLVGDGPALFGALAIGEDLGYGGVVSIATQRDADAAALSECGSVDSDCEIVARFGADTCVAVARDDEAGWIGWATGPDSQETNDAAISECMAGDGSSCAVEDFACNGGSTYIAAGTERDRFAYSIAEEADPESDQPPSPLCGPNRSTYCWHELENHPGCYVSLFHRDIQLDGQCIDGRFNGTVTHDDGNNRSETPYANGVRHGTMIWYNWNGGITEYPYVNGVLHGTQIIRFPDGSVRQHVYVNGERQY